MSQSPFPMEKKRLLGLVAVLSFGLTALFAVLSLEALVAPTFVLGFFVLLPLIAILGDDLSIVQSEDQTVSTDGLSPVERLRERYAAGEIGEAEFERKLERLIETEDLERAVSGRARSPDETAPERDRSVELE